MTYDWVRTNDFYEGLREERARLTPTLAPGRSTLTSRIQRRAAEAPIVREPGLPAPRPTSAPETIEPFVDPFGIHLLAEPATVHEFAATGATEDALEHNRATLPIQKRAAGSRVMDPEQVHQHAAAGVGGSGGPLPHAERIKQSFGPHAPVVDQISAHVGGVAAQAATAIGAEAYATGNSVAFRSAPDLFTAAHEAAHVAQQRAGVQLLGGVGEVGDSYERHADQVAEAVVRGESAASLFAPTGALAAPAVAVQRFGSVEHQSMGNDVHSTLEPLLAASADPVAGSCSQDRDDPVAGECRIPEFGGVTPDQVAEQAGYQDVGYGARQTGSGGGVAGERTDGIVGVPRLGQMLAQDAFFKNRDRNLTLSLRNYETKEDAAGVYLAMQTDPTSNEAIRFDVPVSPGDMTALNGDLYGSAENLRKAPVHEFVTLQGILDAEASWEQRIADGKADAKDAPSFDGLWGQATAWRAQPVFDGGMKIGKAGEAAGGDTDSYIDLALKNQAHFGEETGQKNTIEVRVNAGAVDQLAQGPQGNFASGNEQAWLNGHAKALQLAKEAHAMRLGPGPSGTVAAERMNATMNPYGHEAAAPKATGLVSPAAGNALAPAAVGLDGKPLQRSSGAVTAQSKLNDAYVENAAADHYLTDAFAAGHQIVRDVIGRVMERFVANQGGRTRFIKFVTAQLQSAAQQDASALDGPLGDFRDFSQSSWWFLRSAARGDGLINVATDGMEQQLSQLIDDTKMRAIGAKIVHDYYNTRGLLVSNKKGMTFMIKGDGAAGQAEQAHQIIELAVLESRTQITELANNGITPDPMRVWTYTPDVNKTAFTEDNGPVIIERAFQNPGYLWALVKDYFSASSSGGDTSAANPRVQEKMPRRGPATDMGTPPVQSWLKRRQDYVRQHGAKPGSYAQPGAPVPATVDGQALPAGPDRKHQEAEERQDREAERQRHRPKP